MSCRYKAECPSYTGWCEGPKQDFSKCIPFLITSQEHWKKEAQKQASAAGTLKMDLAVRLDDVTTRLFALRVQAEKTQDSNMLSCILNRISFYEEEKRWIQSILYGGVSNG